MWPYFPYLNPTYYFSWLLYLEFHVPTSKFISLMIIILLELSKSEIHIPALRRGRIFYGFTFLLLLLLLFSPKSYLVFQTVLLIFSFPKYRTSYYSLPYRLVSCLFSCMCFFLDLLANPKKSKHAYKKPFCLSSNDIRWLVHDSLINMKERSNWDMLCTDILKVWLLLKGYVGTIP